MRHGCGITRYIYGMTHVAQNKRLPLCKCIHQYHSLLGGGGGGGGGGGDVGKLLTCPLNVSAVCPVSAGKPQPDLPSKVRSELRHLPTAALLLLNLVYAQSVATPTSIVYSMPCPASLLQCLPLARQSWKRGRQL